MQGYYKIIIGIINVRLRENYFRILYTERYFKCSGSIYQCAINFFDCVFSQMFLIYVLFLMLSRVYFF